MVGEGHLCNTLEPASSDYQLILQSPRQKSEVYVYPRMSYIFFKKLENTDLLAEEGPLSSHLAFRG